MSIVLCVLRLVRLDSVTCTEEQSMDLSTLFAAIAVVISLLSLVATLAFSWLQHRRNDQSRSAHIDLGVQGHLEGPLEDGIRTTKVTATNPGPSAASEVIVALTPIGGEEYAQGVMRLEPGQLTVFSYPFNSNELERVTLAFVDGRGMRKERSWTPKSKSWPLIPWTLRAMRRRSMRTPRGS